MKHPGSFVLIRGGGDLASGVALRLHRVGYQVVITEIAEPLAVRRAVSFAEAVYQGAWEIEGVISELVADDGAIPGTLETGHIPILIDPEAEIIDKHHPLAIVDGRMRKTPSELSVDAARLVIGLGPGFTAGVDCHAVVETKRGHNLGRVYWEGSAQPNTGIPDPVAGFDVQRVIRAPVSGILSEGLPIGSLVEAGDRLALVGDTPITAGFGGALRGMLHNGISVEKGQKIGDLDPRAEKAYCFTVSDKALAVGGGVLEALLIRGMGPGGSA